MVGLAAELRRRGIDLGAADSIVGTSAGATVGAALLSGRDFDSFADDPGAVPPAAVNRELLAATFSVLFGPNPDRDAARRALSQRAMAEDPAQPEHIEPAQWLVGDNDWLDRLRIIAVEAESGERRVWGSDSGIPLATAVSASRALPGTFPPVVVDDRHYIDGGLWSATNADIADDSDILVIIEPLAHMDSRGYLPAELERTSTETVVHFVPDAAMIEVYRTFATNPIASWPEAFRHGVRQADSLAEQLANSGWLG